MLKTFFGDRGFYKNLIGLALPISLQNLIMTSLNLVDTVMIGQLGETAIASVALANQVYFLLSLFLFGVSSGSAVFNAQFWGKRDIPNIRRVMGIGLSCSIFVAVLFMAVSMLIPGTVISIFSPDKMVIKTGSEFLSVVSFSYIMTAVSFCFAFTLRSTGNTRLPMFASAIALGINTILNYLLIFGHFSFPRMGVRGSATATVIARFVEMSIMLLGVYLTGQAPAASFKELFDLKLDFVRRFFKTAVPVILNEVLWSTGMTMYSVAYAHMGTGIIAAVNIAATVERIALVMFVGIANACAVMVGNKIGEGDDTTAFTYAKRLALLGPVLGILAGAAVILLSGSILSVYRVSPEVYRNASMVLAIFGLFIAVKSFNMINIVGILRSGGDTKFGLLIDTAGVWLIAVPLAFIGGLVWMLPLYVVYILVNLEEVFKFVLGLRRFISGRWINNLVKDL